MGEKDNAGGSRQASPQGTDRAGNRILIVMDFLFSEKGGTENQVIKIARSLDRDRFDLSMVFLHGTEWIDANRGTLNCDVRTLRYNFLNHKDPRNILAFASLILHMRRRRPEVVMTFFKISNILGVLAARLAGVPAIISTRRDYGLWLDRWGTRLIRAANRHVDLIVTNSERVKQLTAEHERYDPDRIRVIFNGIETVTAGNGCRSPSEIRRALGIDGGSRVVGIVAGLRPMKNHGTFLRSARRVLSVRRDVEFVVIGDGFERASLQAKAERLNILDRVHFLGWRKDIPDLLSIMDVGVNCSSNEGLSNAIMEYMLHGVPCVVSDQGGNPELITHGFNGFLFPDGDDERLAAHLLELLADEGLRKEFSGRSRDLVTSRFSMEAMTENYRHLFEALRSGGPLRKECQT